MAEMGQLHAYIVRSGVVGDAEDGGGDTRGLWVGDRAGGGRACACDAGGLPADL